ncbi:MAG: hypothetical protein COY39_03490 [Alphaproteobacteria bacterium CG_4_10_14_0_8_um_filter_37_21]|nr:MAG: hypothetical protein COY39_03490 [Alphaproteobacteria bacterium CG_4_10_14_0_8_um_filter_37_21]
MTTLSRGISLADFVSFIQRGNVTETSLRQWLDEAHRAAAQGAQRQENALYFRGVDVHDGERDKSSGHAIQALLESQKTIEKEVFLSCYEDFIKSINLILDAVITDAERRETNLKAEIANMPDNQERRDKETEKARNQELMKQKKADKIKIKQVLGLPGVPQLKGFGAFLNNPIASYGLPRMLPKEFLGRLWYFASELEDKKDQKNAKLSLMSGLADSIETDGLIVCNPGKLQRMIIGVLQGRLPGVNIDKLDFKTPLDIEQKKQIDNALLAQYQKEGAANTPKLFRQLAWDSALENSVKDYAVERIAAVSSMLRKSDIEEVTLQEYDNEENAKATLEIIVKKHPEIAADDLLYSYLSDLLKQLVAK